MKTIIEGSELAVKIFRQESKGILDVEIVQEFDNVQAMIDYVAGHAVDLVILDRQKRKEGELPLVYELRKIVPDLPIIYISDSEAYAMESIEVHAAGYLIKPYTNEDLRYAVETAKLLSRRRKKRILARTFGYFDVFVDGKPIMFKSAKAKELLAFLIDRRGGAVTTEQMISVLWEDRPNDEATQNLCSKLVRTLQKELKAYCAEDMIIVERGNRSVNTDIFECDLYEMLDGSEEAGGQYIGEYLLDYSWAENRTALLNKFLQNQRKYL